MTIKVPEISVIIVGFKSKQYLDACLNSIRHQTIYSPAMVEVIFIDNASFDGSISFIQRSYPWVNTVRNMKNIGCPAALNMGIQYSSGDFILVMNPDVILENNFLENAVKRIKQDNKIAAVCGKIYQYDFNTSEKTSVFDTVGIHIMADREMMSARGSNDFGQFEEPREIFCVRDICALYRKTALDDIKVNGEYFDESFFLYWEGVDVCWRMRLFGWHIWYFPNLVSHHIVDLKNASNIIAVKDREHSYFKKNMRIMIFKNEFIVNIIHDFWFIVRSLIAKDGLFKFIKDIPGILRKRSYIMKHKRVKAGEIRKWFISSKSKKFLTYKAQHLEIYAKFPPSN
jgi:GT2 family glycosyltransferase